MTRRMPKPTAAAALVGVLAAMVMMLATLASPQPARAAACDTSWIGGSGDWNAAGNWSNGLPGVNGPNVCITAAGTYTVSIKAIPGNFNYSIANAPNLILGGPSGQQTLALTGTFTDQTASASLSVGTGSVGANGRILLTSDDPNGVAGASVCLGNGLTNDGTFRVDPGTGGGRTILGILDNRGTMDVNHDVTVPGFHSCGSNGLINSGTIDIAAGANLTDAERFTQTGGTTAVNGSMDASGQIDVSGGSFTGNAPVLTSPNAFSPSAGSGTFVVRNGGGLASDIGSGFTVIAQGTAASDSVLGFTAAANPATNNGTIRLTSTDAAHGAALYGYDSAPASLTNAGNIDVQQGAGGFRTLGLGITNGATGAISIGADTDGACCSSSLRLTNAGGSITVDASKTFALGTSFTQSSGTTTINGGMTGNSTTVSVTGGSFTGNAPVLTNPSTFSPSAGSGSFVIHGSSNFGTDIGSGFTVTAEGTATDDATLNFRAAANPATNNGTLRLTSTSASHSANLFAFDAAPASLTNQGTITVQQGAGGGRSLGQGITNAAAGTLTIGADTDGSCCSGSLKLTNAGTLTIAAGKTFALGGSPFSQTGGTTTVTGAMTGSGNSAFGVSGGTFTGNPPVLTGKQLSPSGGSGTFVVHGSSALNSSVGQNIVLRVEGTATENAVLNESSGANGSTNAGTIRLTSLDPGHSAELYSYDTSTDSMINTGTIDIQQGAGGGRQIGMFIRNAASGTIHVGANTNGFFLRVPNAGSIDVAAGKTLSNVETFTQSAGSLTVDGTLTTGQPLMIQGGALRGTGSVSAPTVNNAGGTVHPGNSPGILSITGNYTQGAAGTLAVDIAGPAAGTGYSRLAVSGNATLDGTLDVTNGFAPSAGQTFMVLTAGGTRSGSFATTDVHGHPTYTVDENPADVTLVPNLPAAPVLTGTTPASGGDDNSPRITGSSGAGTTVRLYVNATCTGAPAGTGTAAQLAGPGIAVSVADNSTRRFRATATNAEGTSGCSPTSVTYTEVTKAAGRVSIGEAPKRKTTKRKATFTFSAPDAASFECKLDKGGFAPCSSPVKYKRLKPGKHTFLVRAVGAAGDAGPISKHRWRVTKRG